MSSEHSVSQSPISDQESGTPSLKALVVVDHVPPTDRESAILERLSEHLGYELGVLDAISLTSKDLTGLDLIVVCTNADIPILREAAVPVLVCRSDALSQMGMTLAQPNVDFGSSDYERVHLDESAVGHTLAAGLTGNQQIAQTAGSRGWGKPGPGARIVATLDGDRNQATIFAYSQGSQMPTAKAPHRRIAFLTAGDHISSATGRNWDLFDAAVAWAKNGERQLSTVQAPTDGEWLEKPDERPPWAGAPSRILSQDEFREWRDDRVAKRVIFRLGTVFSALGLGGLIAGSAYLNNVITGTQENLKKELSTQIEDNLMGQLEQDIDNLMAQMEKDIPEKIAHSIVTVNKLDDRLKERTNEIAGKVAEAVEIFAIEEAEKAVKEKLETGGLDHLVYEKLNESVSNPDLSPAQRIQALRLSVSFSTDALELRDDLREIIKREEDIDVLRVALESYLPAKITDDLHETTKQEYEKENRDALDVILRRLYGSNGSDLHQIHPSFSLALSNFPAPLLVKSIRTNALDQACPVVVDALCAMDSNESIKGLATLAFGGKKSGNTRYLGWRGLSGLNFNPDLVNSEARRDALERLLDGLFKGNLPTQNRKLAELEPHLNKLITAMKNFDNAAIRELEREALGFQHPQLDEFYHFINDEGHLHKYRDEFTNAGGLYKFLEQTARDIPRMKALLNLLHPQDWEVVSSRLVKPNKKIQPYGWRDAADKLLYNWVVSLESAEFGEGDFEHTADLLQKSLDLQESLSKPGSVHAIDFAIRNGGSEEAALFLERFPGKYRRVDFTSQNALALATAQNALATAIKNDTDTFQGTKRMLRQISSARHPDWGLYETVCDNLKPAVDDEEVREFLLRVVNEKDPASSRAGLCAAETLGGLPKKDLKIATDRMLDQLSGLTVDSSAPQIVARSEPDASIERRIDLISALIKKLEKFCEFDEQIVLSRIRAGLPSDENEDLAYVRNQLVSFASGRHVKRANKFNRDFEKSIEESTLAIELDPNMPDAYLARAKAHFGLRDYDAAIKDYGKLIKLSPYEPSYHKELGIALRRKGEDTCNEAVEEFWKAIELRGDNLADKWEMALAYIVLGDEEEAVKYTHEVRDSRVKEERAGVQENLGILYLRLGEWRKAFDNTEKVHGMVGGEDLAWNSLIRAIALQQMIDNPDEENEDIASKEDLEKAAFQKWVQFGKKKWLEDLKELIPADLIDPYEKRTLVADPKFLQNGDR